MANWKQDVHNKMNILVTAGNGLTGNWLRINSAKFSESDYHFHSRLNGDLTNARIVEKLLMDTNPEIILLNAASLSSSKANIEKQKVNSENNFSIFRNFASFITKKQKLFVFSSYHVYSGEPPFGNLNLELLNSTKEYAAEKSKEITLAKDEPNIHFLMFPHLFGRFDNYLPLRAHFIADSIRRIDNAKNLNLSEIQFLGSSEQILQFSSGSMAANFALETVHDSKLCEKSYIPANIGWKCRTFLVFKELCNIIGYTGVVKQNFAQLESEKRERDMFYKTVNDDPDILPPNFINELRATVESYVERTE
jgi:nucleoside-diphosphate-sugar epimerase